VLTRLLETSRRDHVLLVAGINRLFAHSRHNWAVMTRDGKDEGHYDKAHMVPHWEAGYYQAEQMRILARAGLPRLGVAICRDMDFPSWTLRYANARVDVMLLAAVLPAGRRRA
jgi:predicted amidohydrolase